mgnify:CR=1 FL=1
MQRKEIQFSSQVSHVELFHFFPQSFEFALGNHRRDVGVIECVSCGFERGLEIGNRQWWGVEKPGGFPGGSLGSRPPWAPVLACPLTL